MNRKGFTLVELLGTIVIIGLVIAGSAFGIIKLIDESKSKGKNISIASIESAASGYASEKNDDEDYWIQMDRPDIKGKYFCVTIGTLQNKGLLAKDINLDGLSTKDKIISKSTYVGIKKDNITKANSKPTLIATTSQCTFSDKSKCPNEEILYGVCTNTILNEDLTLPNIKAGDSYTDRINNITFDDITEKNGFPIMITKKYFYYADEQEKIFNQEPVEINTKDNSFNISDLVKSKKYYYSICMNTEVSRACSLVTEQSTKDIEKPAFSQSKNNITINYSTKNIYGDKENKPEATYYFKTAMPIETRTDIYKCNSIDDCDSTPIKKIDDVTKLYKSSERTITLSYPPSANSFDVKVEAWTYDKKGNNSSNSSNFKISSTTYTISYNANGGSGAPSSQTKKYNEDIKISSAEPTRSNYTFTGWNTSSSGNGTPYSKGATYKENNDVTLYAQWKANTFTLHYDDNGGRGCSDKTKTLTPGNKLGTLCRPTRSGYWYFNGWYYDGKNYTASTVFNGDSDITLVASWYYDEPEPEPEPEPDLPCTVTTGLWCRSGPGTSYSKVGSGFDAGDRVAVSGKTNNWYYITDSTTDSYNCYASSNYISCSSSGGGSSSGGSTSKSAYCSLPNKLEYFYGDRLAIGGMTVRNKNGICEDADQEKYRKCFNPGLGTALIGNLQSSTYLTITMSCSQIYSSFSFKVKVDSCPSLGSEAKCRQHGTYCMWSAGFCRPRSMTS